MATKERKQLFFTERNTTGLETIVFLHVGNSSHQEWDPVASNPALAAHHLLLPDLPAHSESRDLAPAFTLATAADAVADLITRHAHGGRAHVVGVSLGGYTALVLTAQFPHLVRSCFSSGAMPYTGMFKWFAQRPSAIWLVESATNSIPGLDRLIERSQGLEISFEVRAAIQENRSRTLTTAIFRAISDEFTWDVVNQVAKSGVRTCIVAGAKMDQVDSVRKMGRILQESGEKHGVSNNAVVVHEAVHWWNVQLSDLFARGVRAWIDSKYLPPEFEEL